MRRFRRERRVINLFAFQDVMASVIGILFFIVLLMSLDIVNQQTPTARIDTAILKEYDNLQEEYNRLKNRLEQLQSETEKIVSDTNLASIGEEHIFNEINELHMTLTRLYLNLEEQQKQLVDNEILSSVQEKEYIEKREQLQQLKNESSKLKEQLRLVESRPPIAYIIDKAIPLEPWLLELSGPAIRIAASDGRSVVLEFTADQFEIRKQRFLAWAKSQNPITHYFVILKKPSGLQYENDIEKGIKELGFDIGTDLIPEEYVTF